MPRSALLDPGNRLLGGATGDFSLYGALPAITIGTAGPPAADPTHLTIPSVVAPRHTGDASASDDAPIADPVSALAPIQIDGAATQPLGDLLQSTQSPALLPPVQPPPAAPIGSGSVAPIVADTAMPPIPGTQGAAEATAPLTQGLAASSLSAPVLSAAAAIPLDTALALAPAIAAWATPALDTAAATIGTVDTIVTDSLDLVRDDALPVVGTTVDGVGTGLSATTDAIANSVGATTDTATTATETLAATTADTLAGAGGTVATTADFADDAIGGIAATAVDALAGTTATAADLAAPVTDEALGGTDPAGGVTTLVSMVENAAMFEVAQPTDQPEAAAASTSIIDSLAADEAPAALLGDAAHAADDLLPHHDDGVPGLP